MSGEWSGSPCPRDPDNFWIDDDTGERVSATTGERTAPDLKEQNERIMAAGRAIAAIQDWYWKRESEHRKRVEELFDAAMKANVIYGDYESAEGYWHDLEETLDITRDRINDWASDLDI